MGIKYAVIFVVAFVMFFLITTFTMNVFVHEGIKWGTM